MRAGRPAMLDLIGNTPLVRVTRLDTGTSVTGEDSRFRGDYLHVGRSSVDGRVSLRGFRLT